MQWRLYQRIVLWWAFDLNGLLTMVVSHYFFGTFTSLKHLSSEGQKNEDLIRKLVPSFRFKAYDDI